MRLLQNRLLLVGAILVACQCSFAGPRQGAIRIEPDKVLLKHTDVVSGLVYFPDSVRAASSSYDKTIKIWNIPEGTLLKTLEGHEGRVHSVAVSQDGRHIASGSADHTVRVWDAQSGELLAMLEGHQGIVRGVAFLPGDKRIVSGGADGLRCWDWEQEKLVWRSAEDDADVWGMAVSKHGRRAAICAHPYGDTQVWDLESGKRLLRFDRRSSHPTHGVAISPDGKEVFGHAGPNNSLVRRWDAATGAELPFPPVQSMERIAFFEQANLAVVVTRAGNFVYDTRTWTRLRTLSHANVGIRGTSTYAQHFTYSASFSPDGKTILTGTGGPRTGDDEWAPGLTAVYVYPVPTDWSVPTGPPEGKLSWEMIPATVIAEDGTRIGFDRHEPRDGPSGRGRRYAKRLTDGLDAIWHKGALLLHSEPGVLREVMNETGTVIADVVGDGRHVWVGTLKNGLIMFDRAGKRVNVVGTSDGMLPCGRKLLLHALGPGRVLAAGMDSGQVGSSTAPGSGFVALIEWDGSPATKPKVNALLREEQLPQEWTPRTRGRDSTMNLIWVSGGPTEVWFACGSIGDFPQPIIRVDSQTLQVSTYNLVKADRRKQIDPVSLNSSVPYWRGPRELIFRNGDAVRLQGVGEKFLNQTDQKLLCDAPRDDSEDRLVRFNGQLYAIGTRWRRIDLATLDVEDLGPGLRIDGVLADGRLSHEGEVTYFESGVLGLAALAKEDGCLLRFSIDPAKPLAHRATADPVLPGRDVPPEGRVIPWGPDTLFVCGDGVLQVSAEGKSARGRPSRSFSNSQRIDLESHAEDAQQIQRRINSRAEERQRLALTPAQVNAIRLLRLVNHEADPAQLARWYEQYESAADDTARAAAAKPILAEAKRLADANRAASESFLKEFRGLLSARQWKMANYQMPGPADDATLPKLAEPPAPKPLASGSTVFKRPVPFEERMRRWSYALYAAAALAIVLYAVVKFVQKRKKSAQTPAQ
jgi:hypothetical protein